MYIWKIFGKTFDYFVCDESFDSALDRVRQIEPDVSGGCVHDKYFMDWLDLYVDGANCNWRFDMTYAIYAISKGGCVLKVWRYPDSEPFVFNLANANDDISYVIYAR